MNRLLPIAVFLLSGQLFADTDYFCEMGGYNYTGTSYSDQYGQDSTTGQASCQKRDQMNSDQLGNDYRKNHTEAEELIKDMLNDPECEYLRPDLTDYKNKLEQHWKKFDEQTKARMSYITNYAKDLDVQYAFAFIGAFSQTCSGGQNRRTSFLNLDLINKLMSIVAPVKISPQNPDADDCSDVTASGSDHLSNFNVSMKKAKGKDFQLLFDPFGVPDHLVVKSGGSVIYDSGCIGGDAKERPEFKKIPLDKVIANKITVNVENNCSQPEMNGKGSAWIIRIQCATQPPEQCKEKREKLITLLTKEVELTKGMMDANALRRACNTVLDEKILGHLIEEGLIKPDNTLTNGVCDTEDPACSEEEKGQRLSERKIVVPFNPDRNPSSEMPCPEKDPDEDESILKQVSRAYCKIGLKKLGLTAQDI